VFRNSQVSAIFIQARGIEKTPFDKFLNFFYTVSGLDLFAAGLDVTFEFLSFLNTSSTKRSASMGSSIDFSEIDVIASGICGCNVPEEGTEERERELHYQFSISKGRTKP